MRQYFNAIDDHSIYSFSIKDAITTIDDSTGMTFLAPYCYKPIFVRLNDIEFEKYLEMTDKIAKAYFTCRNDHDKQEMFDMLCIQRQNLVKNASAKYTVCKDIVLRLLQKDELHHCLIYCTPQQIDEVQCMLSEMDVKQSRFTMDLSNQPRQEFNGLSQREDILKKFTEGAIDVLVSMKCLDEGVDIPQARIGLLMASSGNPREYIQRRGRLLRRCKGKDYSTIYDIIVAPDDEAGISDEQFQIEKKIFGKELSRYIEFAGIAMNSAECLEEINRYLFA